MGGAGDSGVVVLSIVEVEVYRIGGGGWWYMSIDHHQNGLS